MTKPIDNNDNFCHDDYAHESILEILRNSLNKTINDVTVEGERDGQHIIVTLDTGKGYRSVRVDVSDLGPDYLEHDEG